MEVKLRLAVVWPDSLMGIYQQESGESNQQFLQRLQALAAKPYRQGRGSLQGRLIGYMTEESWRSYRQAYEERAKNKSKDNLLGYKPLPRVELAMRKGIGLLKCDLTFCGITALQRSFKFFVEPREFLYPHIN